MKTKITASVLLVSVFLFFAVSTVYSETGKNLNVFEKCNNYYIENNSYGAYIYGNDYDTLYCASASENFAIYYAEVNGIIRSVSGTAMYSYALYENNSNYYVAQLNCENGNLTEYNFGKFDTIYNLSFAFCGQRAYFIFSDGTYRYVKSYNADGTPCKTYTFEESVKSVFQNNSKAYAVLNSGDVYRLDNGGSSYCTSINSGYSFCNAGDGYIYSDSGTLFSLNNQSIDHIANAKLNCIYKTQNRIINAGYKTVYCKEKSYINNEEINALLIYDDNIFIVNKDFTYKSIKLSDFQTQGSSNFDNVDDINDNKTYTFTSDGYITGVASQTTVTQFKENLAKQVTLYDKEGKEVTSGKIKTGYRAVVLGDIYQISVTGDVTGEGNVKSNDVSALMSHLTGEKTLEGVYLVSADYNMDGKVDNSDLVYIARYVEMEN